jgi:hypothetical protein
MLHAIKNVRDQVFRDMAATGETIEIDEARYRAAESSVEAGRYPYELLFSDGTRRVCAFAITSGDDLAYPYLGYWTEGEKFYCKRLVDRLVLRQDETDYYLPPLPTAQAGVLELAS